MRTATKEKRKAQMKANAVAWLQAYIENWNQAIEIKEVRIDRVFFRDKNLKAKAAPCLSGFEEGVAKGPVFQKLKQLNHLKKESFSHANWKVNGEWPVSCVGWRGNCEPSEQIVIYPDYTFELDFDHYRGWKHFWEWIRNLFRRGKTNSCKIRKELKEKRKICPKKVC